MVGFGICDNTLGSGITPPGEIVSTESNIYEPESILYRRPLGGAVTSDFIPVNNELAKIMAMSTRNTAPQLRTSAFAPPGPLYTGAVRGNELYIYYH